jgi:hypothetical protein
MTTITVARISVGARKRALLARALLACALLPRSTGAAASEATAVTPAPSAPERGNHCLDRPLTSLLIDQSLSGVVNPLGLDHRLNVYLCLPLIRRPGILFDYTNFRIGLLTSVTPTQVAGGGLVQLWPLSILVLRAEVSGVAIWPIPIAGAGYLGLGGYEPFNREILDPPTPGPDAATTAAGFRAKLGATLQGRASIGSRLTLTVASVFSADYWIVGDKPYYYNARMDAVMKREDWVVLNTATAFIGIALPRGLELRLGAVDDLVYVPGDPYLGNAVYGLIGLYSDKPGGRARRLNAFAWLGGYTHHAFRTGEFTLTAGLEVTWDLMRFGPKAPQTTRPGFDER